MVAIGMGPPAMAEDFREQQRIPFPVLVDRTRKSYRALGLKRTSLLGMLRPSSLLRAAQATLKGHRNALPKQDHEQLGGVVVAARGGRALLVAPAEDVADHPPVAKLLAVLR